jgi:hypothetical protein
MKKFQVIILFLFLIGCSPKQAIPSTTTPDTPIPPTPSLLPTETTTAIPSTPTLTPTSVPIVTTTPAPIWTPIPTLSQADVINTLHVWTMGTLDCLLPCWGGVTPGKTNWQETKQLLESFSGYASLKVAENGNCAFGQCNSIGWSLSPETLAEGHYYTLLPGDIVHFINIDLRNEGTNKTNFARDIRMRNVFKLYGLPDQLLFDANIVSLGNRYLEVILVYPERQFIIIYRKKAKIDGDKAVMCGGYTRVRIIILDNKDQLSSLDAISKAAETKDLEISTGHKSAQEAIGMTNSAFYEYFSAKREPCISTPLEIWGR